MVVAGNGGVTSPGFRPGVPATDAPLPIAGSVAALPGGAFAVGSGCVVWKVSAGLVDRLAGAGTCAFAGDGGAAAAAWLEAPQALAATPDGGLLIGDGHRVRLVGADGRIATVAGSGAETISGDGGPATGAGIGWVAHITALPTGGFLFTDSERVRRVDAAGVITTVAGTGKSGFSGDGGPATRARLALATEEAYGGGLAALPDGGFLVADTGNQRVRAVDAAGTIRTVAGNGHEGHSGDRGLAVRAALWAPQSPALNADGSYEIGARGAIRHVAADGTITSVAGRSRDAWRLTGVGTAIFAGSGLAPRYAAINAADLARAADGTLLIANGDDGRVFAITTPTTTLPAVALVRTRLTAKRLEIGIVATVRGLVHVTATGPRSVSTTATVGSGRSTVALARPRAAGVYRVRASVGAATATVGIVIGRLSVRTAHGAIYGWADGTQLSNGHIRGCHRFSASRVDCTNAADDESCLFVTAVSVGSSGLPHLRDYRCPGYRRHPHWCRADGTYPPFRRPGVLPGPLFGGA